MGDGTKEERDAARDLAYETLAECSDMLTAVVARMLGVLDMLQGVVMPGWGRGTLSVVYSVRSQAQRIGTQRSTLDVALEAPEYWALVDGPAGPEIKTDQTAGETKHGEESE